MSQQVNNLLMTNDLVVLEAALYLLLRPLQQYLSQLPTSHDLGVSLRQRLLALSGGWEPLHTRGSSLSDYTSSSDDLTFSGIDSEYHFSFYSNMEAVSSHAESSTSPTKPTVAPLPGGSSSMETPTRPTLATARSEGRVPQTPGAKATVHPLENNLVSVNFGKVRDSKEEWYPSLISVVQDRMDSHAQITLLNKARVLMQSENGNLDTRRKLLACRLLALSCYRKFSLSSC